MNPLRILTIAAYYPPSSAAAAIRARNIVLNLRELGHDVVVITARMHGDGSTPPPETHAVAWLDLEDLAKSRLQVSTPYAGAAAVPAPRWQKSLRTLAARLIVPDLHAPWIPPAAVRASHFVGASDLLLSTGTASAHVVARLVRRGRPWIADINDFWWGNPHRKAGPVRTRIDWLFERGIVASATALTVPNDALGTEIHARFGRVPPATVFTGFDRSEFDLPTETAPPSTREIVFAGTLYADFPLSVLLDSLARGRNERGWSSSTIRVVFIGTGAADAVSEARRYGVDELVDAVPAMPRRDLLMRLRAADALLFPLYPSDPYHLPMRFFDFVGSARPMIGVGSAAAPGAKMIERHSLGVVCSTADELVGTLDDLVRTGRGADLPPEMQGVFELGSARPALQEVLERVTVPHHEFPSRHA